MDESLSDFQEPKKSCAGPKTTTKTKSAKPKKVPKKIRGQRDIRRVLKGKQELELYSKDFDKVCKKAGIDVDSEQLQVAIALSKSLQNEPSTSNETSESNGVVTTQDRVGKIRTTLQEYGFKVPEIKITTTNRKLKKYRKNYNLILTSDTQKKELIANKYSEVLFQNISHCSLNSDSSSFIETSVRLYYLATSVNYNTLKIGDLFYVENLIEKSMSTGNLLRDWSEIPGRSVSPELFEPSNMNFSDIECSQKELDIVLSGSLKSCKNIFYSKNKQILARNYVCNAVLDASNIKVCNNSINNAKVIDENDHEDTFVNNDPEVDISITNKSRCVSPDIFDEDASSILDDGDKLCVNENKRSPRINKNITSKVVDVSESVLNNNFRSQTICENVHRDRFSNSDNQTKRTSNDYMEITDCIDIKPKYGCEIIGHNSQKNNVTNRISNDYMEMTECVATSSQVFSIDDKIDLTKMPDIPEDVVTGKINKALNNNPTLDLPNTEVTGIKTNLITSMKDDYVDLIVGQGKGTINKPELIDHGNIDLTQSSNSSDELPFVCLSAKKDNSLDDDVIDLNDCCLNKKSNSQDKDVCIDLTQYEESTTEISKPSQNFFDEYVHNHSDNIEEINNDSGSSLQHKINSPNKDVNSNEGNIFENNCDKYLYNTCNEHDTDKVNLTLSPIHKPDNNLGISKMDLTQNSDASENLSPCSSQIDSILKDSSKDDRHNPHVSDVDNYASTSRNSLSYSSLGKKDGISIDYDELCATGPVRAEISRSSCSKSLIYEITDEDNEDILQNNILLNSSQNSEVFQISDKELNYSMHQSKLERPAENFALGGISIMDELSNLVSFKKSVENNHIPDNTEYANENLETVKTIGRNEISPIKHRRITEIATPQTACSSNTVYTVVTPKNSEFIIKTNNVTPMKDYELMSTPEIHKELDKYGIKPFKRKRAIQLLTHIYNQTHPIIETYMDEPSPPKRRKPNDSPITSPRKRISPRQLLKSPRKVPESDNNDGNLKKKGSPHKFRESNNIAKEDIIQSKTKEVTGIVMHEVPTSTDIECKPEDWVFQKREKAKLHSCRVPLHVAFYNYVMSRSELREAILRYEPVNIDDLHKGLVSYGHRYDPKDLLKFMDKKCITVKTTDNDARNYKR